MGGGFIIETGFAAEHVDSDNDSDNGVAIYGCSRATKSPLYELEGDKTTGACGNNDLELD